MLIIIFETVKENFSQRLYKEIYNVSFKHQKTIQTLILNMTHMQMVRINPKICSLLQFIQLPRQTRSISTIFFISYMLANFIYFIVFTDTQKHQKHQKKRLFVNSEYCKICYEIPQQFTSENAIRVVVSLQHFKEFLQYFAECGMTEEAKVLSILQMNLCFVASFRCSANHLSPHSQ